MPLSFLPGGDSSCPLPPWDSRWEARIGLPSLGPLHCSDWFMQALVCNFYFTLYVTSRNGTFFLTKSIHQFNMLFSMIWKFDCVKFGVKFDFVPSTIRTRQTIHTRQSSSVETKPVCAHFKSFCRNTNRYKDFQIQLFKTLSFVLTLNFITLHVLSLNFVVSTSSHWKGNGQVPPVQSIANFPQTLQHLRGVKFCKAPPVPDSQVSDVGQCLRDHGGSWHRRWCRDRICPLVMV